MNIIFFSPQFPGNYYHFCAGLRRLGCTVLGIADADYDSLRPELREALTEYYRVERMDDYDQVLRATGYFTHKYGKIDRFESHTEYWLETDARIRTDFNIPGIKTGEIAQMKHKSLMKERFAAAGVSVAPGAVVHNLQEAETFVAQAGYPVVAKPDNGVGASGTRKLSSAGEMQEFFALPPAEGCFLEGFISGRLYSFDGLADRDGRAVFCTAHSFSQGIMETVNHDLDLFYYSLRDIPPELEQAGLATLQAFGVKERFFHFEFFLDDAGRAVALEVNMRPPGGPTMDMFNYANDADLYQQWANIVVSNRFDAVCRRPYHCAYIGRKYNKEYRRTHEEILAYGGRMIVQHEPVDGIFSAALGNYGYVARAEQMEELQDLIRFAQEKR